MKIRQFTEKLGFLYTKSCMVNKDCTLAAYLNYKKRK